MTTAVDWGRKATKQTKQIKTYLVGIQKNCLNETVYEGLDGGSGMHYSVKI